MAPGTEDRASGNRKADEGVWGIGAERVKEKEGTAHPKYEEMIIMAITELKSRSVELFL